MKLSISNIGWRPEYDEEIYKYISEVGYRGIEIAPTKLFGDNPYEKLELAKNFSLNLKRRYGLEISSIQSILYGREEKLFGSEEERLKLLDYTKKAIEFASIIGCHNLVFGAPKNRIILDSYQYFKGIEFFKALGDYAKKRGTVISIEANPIIYGTNFIIHTEEAFKIVNEVNSEGFKVNLDLGTILYNKEDIGVIYKHIEMINHVHISEPNLEMIKVRKVHKKLFEILKSLNYIKYISIEMKQIDDINIVKRIINYIREVSL